MKNLIFATLMLGASMVALTAMAADVKVAELSIASRPALEKAVVKIGNFSGQPMIGAMGVGLLNGSMFQEKMQELLGKKLTVVCDEERLAEMPDVKMDMISSVEDSVLDDGCVAKVSVFMLGKMYHTKQTDCDPVLNNDSMKAMADLLMSDVERLDVSVWISDAGLDLRLAVKLGGDSGESLGEIISLGADPTPYIPRDALFFIAYSDAIDRASQFVEAISGLRKDVPEFGFIDCKNHGGVADIQVDIANLPAPENPVSEPEKDDYSAAFAKMRETLRRNRKLAAPKLQGFSFTANGIQGYAGAADMFAGEDISRCDFLAKFSICRLVKAVLSCPQLKNELVNDENAALTALFSQTLCPDGADIGVKVWHDGSCLNCTIRANPAEVKGLSMMAAAIIPAAINGSFNTEGMRAKVLGDDEAPVFKITRERGARTIRMYNPNRIANRTVVFDGFSIAKVVNSEGDVVKRVYKLFRGTKKDRKLVHTITVPMQLSAEDKAFDAKWLAGVKPVSDKIELEMLACRTIARRMVDLLGNDEPEEVSRQVVEVMVKGIQDKFIRPYAGRPGISAAILRVLTTRLPDRPAESHSSGRTEKDRE